MTKKSNFKKKLKATVTTMTTAGVLLISIPPSYAEEQQDKKGTHIKQTQEQQNQKLDTLTDSEEGITLGPELVKSFSGQKLPNGQTQFPNLKFGDNVNTPFEGYNTLVENRVGVLNYSPIHDGRLVSIEQNNTIEFLSILTPSFSMSAGTTIDTIKGAQYKVVIPYKSEAGNISSGEINPTEQKFQYQLTDSQGNVIETDSVNFKHSGHADDEQEDATEFKFIGTGQEMGLNLTFSTLDSRETINRELSITPSIKQVILAAPEVADVYDTDTTVTGTAVAGAEVIVKADGKELGTATADDKGNYSVTIEPQKADTKLTVTAKKSSIESKATEVTVKETAPVAPEVNGVQDIDTVVTGTAKVGSTVKVKTGMNQLGTSQVSENGTYSVEIPKQKAGTKLTVTASNKAGTSKTTEVEVKETELGPELVKDLSKHKELNNKLEFQNVKFGDNVNTAFDGYNTLGQPSDSKFGWMGYLKDTVDNYRYVMIKPNKINFWVNNSNKHNSTETSLTAGTTIDTIKGVTYQVTIPYESRIEQFSSTPTNMKQNLRYKIVDSQGGVLEEDNVEFIHGQASQKGTENLTFKGTGGKIGLNLIFSVNDVAIEDKTHRSLWTTPSIKQVITKE
ncbi:Ig-like domain-containing protein [Bacillus cereus]|uniref:Ig-like domain-containing protein n=1 Tax=Bacillus cereus TaxID=1396 RepID=UPI000BF8C266|nr:Ig-like domain-containing protein [Bacillus cereus]PFI79101.1 hypothetical protein COI83_25320 [Bacillus cereus]